MHKILETISYAALVLLVVAPVLFYMGRITLGTNKILLLVATVIWFASAIGWMGRKKEG